MIRWYQAGVWLPFFRQHAHIETKRREPWTYDKETMDINREALRLRYSYLPLWYTLFREHELSGSPVIRPIWAHYPTESESFTIDDQLLVGDAILVKPVVHASANDVSVYFPGEGKVSWYDIETMKKYGETKRVSIPVTLHKTAVYQKEGSIVPRKMRIRRSTVAMKNDPYTLIVIADKEGKAEGTLYIDDETSFEYRHGKYIYLRFEFENKRLTSNLLQKLAMYETKSWLEKVEIVNPPQGVTKAIIHSKGIIVIN